MILSWAAGPLFKEALAFCGRAQMHRTYIYIDGFNLYYRSLKGTRYKWLDLMRLFKGLLNNHNDIQKIKYFTARVKPEYSDPGKPHRQDAYLRAIQTCPQVEVFYGHFLSHPVSARLVNPINGQKFAEVIKTEEKGSDVNIAVNILNDAWLNLYDCAIIVSNDSDLAEAMRLVKLHHPQKILGLITPTGNANGKSFASKQLSQYADFQKNIRTANIAASQFTDVIDGTTIAKPKGWY